HVVAAARGKKRGAKRESVYFAADSQMATRTPDFADIKRHSDDGPSQIPAIAFQHSFKLLGDSLWLRHGASLGPSVRRLREACCAGDTHGNSFSQSPFRWPRGRGICSAQSSGKR